MKAKEIRQQGEQELQAQLREQTQLLGNLQYNHHFSAIENPARMRAIRATIARIRTIMTERGIVPVLTQPKKAPTTPTAPIKTKKK